jgi:MoxR-like ATPase
VIVLDEINRLNPLIVNTLLPLLDGRRQTYLEESGEKIVVGKGVVFFSTTNEGREFTGTIQLDLAQADRLCTKVECTYLQEKDESKLLNDRTSLDSESCKKLVQVANHVRRKYMSDTGDSFTQNISTRMLLNAAQKMHLGGAKTLRYTLLSHFSDDGKEGSERAQLLKLLQGKFGPIM